LVYYFHKIGFTISFDTYWNGTPYLTGFFLLFSYSMIVPQPAQSICMDFEPSTQLD
jgi:hypothetical protein